MMPSERLKRLETRFFDEPKFLEKFMNDEFYYKSSMLDTEASIEVLELLKKSHLHLCCEIKKGNSLIADRELIKEIEECLAKYVKIQGQWADGTKFINK